MFAILLGSYPPNERIWVAAAFYLLVQRFALWLLLAIAEAVVLAVRCGASVFQMTTHWAFIYAPHMIMNGVVAAIWAFGLSQSAR